ncbi:VWA domain-containing protein [Octadecabacter sp. 1_MG-2023]|uniref:vWA domain-containing protein n=1 Tax=unclassified Octadecabacter TaxID=196158 RepID=UPI001C08A547|nr:MULTISPECIES: VWA domain-containing protein [unclassified Octadecabacter]MBU2994328.1 VWA domain-containing protein [Octadecabacter sp. B2R22]MDO6734383.1 VWA domain-containing protein [Octadecabacter sp. 1_MG-2023]
MSDDFDLDDLKSAMNAATPAPDTEAKARNIALAAKNFADLQGSRDAARHTTRPTKWTGVKDMLNKLTSRGGLTVTTAIVACGVMITTPQGRDILNLDPTTKVATPETLVQPEATPIGSVSVATAQADDIDEEADLRARVEPAPAIVAEAEGAVLLEQSAESISISPAAPLALSREMAVGDAIARDMAPAGYVGTIAPPPDANTETYANDTPNPLKITSDDPVSTFSIDVDTAAYSVVRSSLTAGQLPPEQAVRIEELINYFPYAYPTPEGPHPFQPTVNVFETPWNADTQLVHIGIQGEMPAVEDRPPLNLVFLIDTSGSMESTDKLPLLRQSFRLMLDNLRPEDAISIVTYAGSTSIALEPTAASERTEILKALNDLRAGGSTNGQGGLEAAYAMAEQMTDDGDVSRVILATDGDFNVGLSDPRGLEAYIEDKRDSGTYLSVLGFGRGNLQDATMQSLAQNGNGTAAYIDTLSEAQKVLVDNLTGALFPIANDVKIQVEFNPATIAEYRLIGYETRALAREDFNNDAVDAGELGAGHTVTAIYEVTPVGSPAQLSDPLRYQAAETTATSDELGFLRLRYKAPGEDVSQLIETPFSTVGAPDTEALFAASIAGFGQLLRDDTYLGDWGWDDAIALANANRGTDQFGYRTEAVQLMRLAQSLSN